MIKKRAQVTIFIILGIVIAFIFFTLFYVTSKVNEERSKEAINAIQNRIISNAKWNRYVTSCLEEATRKAIFLAGMQGGAIYNYQASGTKIYRGPPNEQYGNYILPFKNHGYYSDDDVLYNVSYGITKPVEGTPGHPLPPDYPYGRRKLIPYPNYLNPPFVNTLGNSEFPGPFPPLCDSFGKNRKDIPGAIYTCESYDAPIQGAHNSIQEYIEAYVKAEVKKCVNFSRMPELAGKDVKLGNITISTMFTPDFINVFMKYPIQLEVRKKIAEMQIGDFHTSVKTRIKQIHELVTNLIDEEVNNIRFDIQSQAGTLRKCRDSVGRIVSCLKSNMSVYRLSDVCGTRSDGLCLQGFWDDVLVIEDNETVFGGMPYIFQLAIENRRPAIDLIRKTPEGTIASLFDVIVIENATISIDPTGYDPDEESSDSDGIMTGIYRYEGWKESYDEYFDYNRCEQNPEDCFSDPDSYTNPNYAVIPKEWTQSMIFTQTNKNASYTTTQRDLGLHKLKVEICDGENLCDHQDVIILVQNKPIIGGQKYFTDIPSKYASIEDPMELSIFLLVPSSDISKVRWSDKAHLEFQNIDTAGTKINLPEGVPPNLGAGIREIETASDLFTFNNVGMHTISVAALGGNDLPIYSGEFDLDVRECVPHRDSSPPYPFNTNPEPFKADHTCCPGNPSEPATWGKPLDKAGQECFHHVEYGCYDDFKADLWPEAGSIPIYWRSIGETDDDYPSIPGKDPSTIPSGNFVWKREVIGKCDGVRGNMCTGEKYEIRTLVEECTGGCKGCRAGSMTCVNHDSSTTCDEDRMCAVQNGLAVYEDDLTTLKEYFDDDGNPLPYSISCQLSCDGRGNCNIASNCECDQNTCNTMECDSPEDSLWEPLYDDRQSLCKFGCNLDTCRFGAFEPICPNKDNGQPTSCVDPRTPEGCTPCNVIDGAENCDGITNPCISSELCVTDVSCDKDGAHWGDLTGTGEYCRDPGKRGLISGDLYCYKARNPGTDCDASGQCNAKEKLEISCEDDLDSLKREDYNHCLVGNTCNMPESGSTSICTPDGWKLYGDTDFNYIDDDGGITTNPCGTSDCDDGAHFDSTGGYCYFDIECTNEGWIASDRSECSFREIDDNCVYPLECRSSGTPHCRTAIETQDEAEIRIGGPCTGTWACTNQGWTCQTSP